MVPATSAELEKNFAFVRQRALQEPVRVTVQVKKSLVVITAEEFERLRSLDTRQAFYLWELPTDLTEALQDATPSLECPDVGVVD